MSAALPPFRPSEHGCRFGNGETHRVPITVGPVRLGRVTGGLCGGMVLDSLRAWRDGEPPAGRQTRDLSRVFGAQLRSFQVPSAPLQYARLQRPGAAAARRRVTDATREKLARKVGSGAPVPVALVSALSRSPRDLSAHHVVLAYDVLEHDAAGSTFAIYDPNYPGDDGIVLRLAPDGNRHSRGRPVHAAFALRAR